MSQPDLHLRRTACPAPRRTQKAPRKLDKIERRRRRARRECPDERKLSHHEESRRTEENRRRERQTDLPPIRR